MAVVISVVKTKIALSPFHYFPRERFLCNFCRLFQLKRDYLFVNNRRRNSNRRVTEVNRDALHLRKFKPVKNHFESFEVNGTFLSTQLIDSHSIVNRREYSLTQ